MWRSLLILLFIAGCSPSTIVTHYQGSPAPPASMLEWQTRVLPSDGSPESLRNAQLSQAMMQIDASYDAFRLQYFANRTTFDTVGDLVGLGLNGAGILVGGPALKAALAAAAGGVIGFRSVIDRNLFAEQSRVVTVMTMDANRAEARVAIIDGMMRPVSEYPLEIGMQDVTRYYEAGSIVNAMLAIATQSGAKVQAAQQRLLAR